MRTFSRPTHHGQGGQGISEYLIIVALIAIAAIGVYSFFGARQQSPQELPAKAPSKEISGAQTSPSVKPDDSGGAGDKKSAGTK
jgi:hypothetical protein